MGGQAVLEGVMMRGENTWAVAVRNPDGEIVVDVRDVPGWSERYRKIPILRGVMGLGESLGLGYRALTWSANQQVPEEEQVSEKTMGFAVIFSMLVFAGLFIVLPALRRRPARRRVDPPVPSLRGHRAARAVRRLPRGDLVHPRHPPGVPVPRRGAQDDRGVRERRRAHARSRPTSSRPRTCGAARTSCSR